MNDDPLLAEQRAFYERRAPEYDEWWQRRGRYDHGEEEARKWRAEVAQVAGALAEFNPTGDVLELAGGTGWWTARLAETAERLTVLDASAAALDLNRRRVTRPDVAYVVTDLFAWTPGRAYDLVFFSFWLSHVPTSRFNAFWRQVGACLAPGGRAFLIDNRRDPSVTRADPYVFAEADGVQRRRLNDGSEHRVVKVFYEPQELTDRLATLGWEAALTRSRSFIYGSAQRR